MKKGPSLKEVQDVYNKYKKFIFKEIVNVTKINWKIKEIKFQISDKDSWYAEIGGDTIFIGRYYKPQSKILTSIIHEAIHLNTINKKVIGSKESFLTREIATCILTNIIIKKANKIFKKRFKKNRFDNAYRIYENKSNEFERERRNKNFYEFFELIRKSIT